MVSHKEPSTPSFIPRRLRAASKLAAVLWWSSVAFATLIFLIWLTIYGLIVPRIDQLRPTIENKLSQALGVELRIGAVKAQTLGRLPSFEMSQVRMLDKQGRDALVLRTVTATLSPRSLWNLSFDQLHIEQPELAIRRDAQGRISVAGLDMSGSETDIDAQLLPDWFFSHSEFVISSGTIRWMDEQRQTPVLALEKVDVHIRNSGRKHQIRIDATPPATWGERFMLAGDFRSPLLAKHPGDWRSWEGQIYTDFKLVDVQELKHYTGLGIDIQQGRGGLRAWLVLSKGRLQETTLDLALANVNIKLEQSLEPLILNILSGRMTISSTNEAFGLRTEQLAFQLRDGLNWPGGNMQLSLAQNHDPMRAKGELIADKLDLAALAQISDRLPVDASAHRWLKALKPQGHISNLQVSWHGPYHQPIVYQLQGSAQSITIQASPTPSASSPSATALWHPGVRNANIDFKLNEKSGQAKLRIASGSLTLPGVFENSTIPFDELSTDFKWQTEGEKWQVELAQLKFANADAQGEGKARWHTADAKTQKNKSRLPGIIDLQGNFARADGTKVWRYLPLNIPQTARDYVRDSILQGKASNGAFKIKGDLFEMPFADAKRGEFRISAQISDASMNYVPATLLPTNSQPWPTLTQINGELVFDRTSMTVKGANAKVVNAPNLQLTKIDVQIPDLTQQQTVVIQAQIQGAATDMLNVVTSSPLNSLTQQALSQTKATGGADGRMRLQLPIHDLEKSRVQGTVTLANNDVQITPDSPLFQQARGVVSFNEKGFVLKDSSARAFGGELRLEGGSRVPVTPSDASLTLRAQGTASAEGLRQSKELGLLSRIAGQAAGSVTYVANFNIRSGQPEIVVSSNLQGLSLNLPQPLQKNADTLLPMRYENSLVRESIGSGRRLQDQIFLELGNLATVSYQRDISGPAPRVIRGRIGVGLTSGEVAAGNEDPGVAANINFTQIDLDAWSQLLSTTAPAAAIVPVTINTENSTRMSSETLGYLPSIMSIRARELTIQGRTLNNVVVGGSRDDLTWRANLDARELNGYLEYRQPSAGNSGRVYARLARLSLAAAAATDIEATLDAQPTNIPALDIIVEDFELRGRKLGRVEVEALNRDSAGVREWRLSKLNVGLPEAQLSATGNWAQLNASGLRNSRNDRRRTALNFKLEIADSGELLKRFGQDKVISKGKGRMEGQVAWLGAPWALDYNSMVGGFNVNIESGQFLRADPGIAKLLGVLSLQSLRRRLGLDFRDVVNEGFSFDFIRGDIKIDQGIASTNNFQMKGVNAAVLMEGNASIAKETQSLKVVVVPEINAGTASLIATAINPAIGIGTFLAQLILRRPVIEAATQEYRVEGSWTEPRIERINRRDPANESNTKPTESGSSTGQ
jgi:uncharacterized protein (TIGR02099 family)